MLPATRLWAIVQEWPSDHGFKVFEMKITDIWMIADYGERTVIDSHCFSWCIHCFSAVPKTVTVFNRRRHEHHAR